MPQGGLHIKKKWTLFLGSTVKGLLPFSQEMSSEALRNGEPEGDQTVPVGIHQGALIRGKLVEDGTNDLPLVELKFPVLVDQCTNTLLHITPPSVGGGALGAPPVKGLLDPLGLGFGQDPLDPSVAGLPVRLGLVGLQLGLRHLVEKLVVDLLVNHHFTVFRLFHFDSPFCVWVMKISFSYIYLSSIYKYIIRQIDLIINRSKLLKSLAISGAAKANDSNKLQTQKVQIFEVKKVFSQTGGPKFGWLMPSEGVCQWGC